MSRHFGLARSGGRDGSHLGHELLVAAIKVFVSKHNGIIGTDSAIDLSKAPAVELARETAEFGWLEELGDDGAREFVGIFDDERLAVGEPVDAVIITVVRAGDFGVAHHFHELIMIRRREY